MDNMHYLSINDINSINGQDGLDGINSVVDIEDVDNIDITDMTIKNRLSKIAGIDDIRQHPKFNVQEVLNLMEVKFKDYLELPKNVMNYNEAKDGETNTKNVKNVKNVKSDETWNKNDTNKHIKNGETWSKIVGHKFIPQQKIYPRLNPTYLAINKKVFPSGFRTLLSMKTHATLREILNSLELYEFYGEDSFCLGSYIKNSLSTPEKPREKMRVKRSDKILIINVYQRCEFKEVYLTILEWLKTKRVDLYNRLTNEVNEKFNQSQEQQTNDNIPKTKQFNQFEKSEPKTDNIMETFNDEEIEIQEPEIEFYESNGYYENIITKNNDGDNGDDDDVDDNEGDMILFEYEKIYNVRKNRRHCHKIRLSENLKKSEKFEKTESDDRKKSENENTEKSEKMSSENCENSEGPNRSKENNLKVKNKRKSEILRERQNNRKYKEFVRDAYVCDDSIFNWESDMTIDFSDYGSEYLFY